MVYNALRKEMVSINAEALALTIGIVKLMNANQKTKGVSLMMSAVMIWVVLKAKHKAYTNADKPVLNLGIVGADKRISHV